MNDLSLKLAQIALHNNQFSAFVLTEVDGGGDRDYIAGIFLTHESAKKFAKENFFEDYKITQARLK